VRRAAKSNSLNRLSRFGKVARRTARPVRAKCPGPSSRRIASLFSAHIEDLDTRGSSSRPRGRSPAALLRLRSAAPPISQFSATIYDGLAIAQYVVRPDWRPARLKESTRSWTAAQRRKTPDRIESVIGTSERTGRAGARPVRFQAVWTQGWAPTGRPLSVATGFGGNGCQRVSGSGRRPVREGPALGDD
jgi:hypothetical protein